MSCQYCIVGCGYKSYVWSASGPNGTPDAAGNASAPTTRSLPSPAVDRAVMFNVIRRADGKDYNVAIVPDKDCVVNHGNHSPAAAPTPRASGHPTVPPMIGCSSRW